MSDVITVVAGLGRCGSSMIMHMLVQGGMSVTGSAVSPFWEDGRSTWLPHKSDWLDECNGKVVKILSPDRMTPPLGYSYRWIWLDRDKAEQVKSQKKLAAWMNRRRRDYEIGKERASSLKTIEAIGGPILMMQYEDIVVDAASAAKAAVAINAFVGGDLKLAEMIAAVRIRDPKCSKEMEEARGCLDPIEYVSREAADGHGIVERICNAVGPTGIVCGAKKFHEGRHTWAADPKDMHVLISPANLFKFVGTCPGCLAVVNQVVPHNIAQAVQDGGAVQGLCPKCGQKCNVTRRQILTPRSVVQPKIVLAKK